MKLGDGGKTTKLNFMSGSSFANLSLFPPLPPYLLFHCSLLCFFASSIYNPSLLSHHFSFSSPSIIYFFFIPTFFILSHPSLFFLNLMERMKGASTQTKSVLKTIISPHSFTSYLDTIEFKIDTYSIGHLVSLSRSSLNKCYRAYIIVYKTCR